MACFFGRGWAGAACAWWSLVMLAGCVSTRPPEETKGLPVDHGAAVLKLVSDGQAGARDPGRIVVAARVRRDGVWTSGGFRRARLVRTQAATHATVVLGGILEPGQYSVESLEMVYDGRDEKHVFADDAWRFEVKARATTTLGTLVFQGRQFAPSYLPPDDAFARSVQQSYPALVQTGAPSVVVASQRSAGLPDARPLMDGIKRNARAADAWSRLENGDFAAPGRLGTILYRKSVSARPEVIDVGGESEVLSVRSFRGGLLIAGEEGLLRFSQDGRSAWRPLDPPAVGMIRMAQPLADGGVLVVMRTGARWVAYRSQDVFGGSWRQVATFGFPELPHDDSQPLPFAIPLPNGVGLLQMSGAYRLVEADGQVRESTTDIPSALHATSDGLVTLAKRRSVGTRVSFDQGLTWGDVQMPPSTLVIAFQDRQRYFAIAGVPGDALNPTYATYVTRDGGASWARSGKSPVGAGEASRFWAAPGGRLQIELQGGDMVQSIDAGATWTRLP